MKNKEKTRSVLSRFSSRSICALPENQRFSGHAEYRLHKHTWFCGGDKQTLQQTYFRRSASCVQSFDDSLDIAIRITYRISLRSSSLWEPRHPLLKVLIRYFVLRKFRITWFLWLFLFRRNEWYIVFKLIKINMVFVFYVHGTCSRFKFFTTCRDNGS